MVPLYIELLYFSVQVSTIPNDNTRVDVINPIGFLNILGRMYNEI